MGGEKMSQFLTISLLAYYDFLFGTGPLEGTNNKMKTKKSHIDGFRNMELFRLKILVVYNTKQALLG